MKKHLQYLRYLVRHKYFVFVAGLKTGAPLCRLIIHDWSKFLPSEWFPYANYFYDPRRTRELKVAFDFAWLHHQHFNPHHWQHWILRNDNGEVVCLEMPEDFVREMVADWAGAGRTITGKWEVAKWYAKNSGVIQLHPNTRELLEDLLSNVFPA